MVPAFPHSSQTKEAGLKEAGLWIRQVEREPPPHGLLSNQLALSPGVIYGLPSRSSTLIHLIRVYSCRLAQGRCSWHKSKEGPPHPSREACREKPSLLLFSRLNGRGSSAALRGGGQAWEAAGEGVGRLTLPRVAKAGTGPSHCQVLATGQPSATAASPSPVSW